MPVLMCRRPISADMRDLAGKFHKDWRVADDLATFLESWIVRFEPKIIVEFGSGYSTVLMANLVDAWEGVVIAFEQDEDRAEQTRKVLDDNDLIGGTVIYSPIKDGWYSQVAIPDLVDLVLVSGPGPCKNLTRAPAMAAVYSQLRSGGLVVVDDANRSQTMRDVEAWPDNYPNLRSSYFDFERGVFLVWKF